MEHKDTKTQKNPKWFEKFRKYLKGNSIFKCSKRGWSHFTEESSAPFSQRILEFIEDRSLFKAAVDRRIARENVMNISKNLTIHLLCLKFGFSEGGKGICSEKSNILSSEIYNKILNTINPNSMSKEDFWCVFFEVDRWADIDAIVPSKHSCEKRIKGQYNSIIWWSKRIKPNFSASEYLKYLSHDLPTLYNHVVSLSIGRRVDITDEDEAAIENKFEIMADALACGTSFPEEILIFK